jgi:hypothetical protein
MHRHPNPCVTPIRDLETPLVGCFHVAFQDDPDHEYLFGLHEDGLVVPIDIPEEELEAEHLLLLPRFLRDKRLHHCRFIQYLDTAIPDASNAFAVPQEEKNRLVAGLAARLQRIVPRRFWLRATG